MARVVNPSAVARAGREASNCAAASRALGPRSAGIESREARAARTARDVLVDAAAAPPRLAGSERRAPGFGARRAIAFLSVAAVVPACSLAFPAARPSGLVTRPVVGLLMLFRLMANLRGVGVRRGPPNTGEAHANPEAAGHEGKMWRGDQGESGGISGSRCHNSKARVHVGGCPHAAHCPASKMPRCTHALASSEATPEFLANNE